jgi:hypothetical protein
VVGKEEGHEAGRPILFFFDKLPGGFEGVVGLASQPTNGASGADRHPLPSIGEGYRMFIVQLIVPCFMYFTTLNIAQV